MKSSPDHQTLHVALIDVNTAIGASEAHGLLCGMLSAPGDTAPADWIAQVLAGTHLRGEAARGCLGVLSAVFESTREAVRDPDLRFQPLLPEDEVSMDERARALGTWCQGFLAGLGLRSGGQIREWPPEVTEVLRDFGEIAQVDTGVTADGEGENAYAELVEYVRVGALLVLESMMAATARRAR